MSRIEERDIKLKSKTMHIMMEHYNTAQEVVEDCKTRTITDHNFKNMQKVSLDKDWEGVKTYNEALDLLKNGYEETIKKLQDKVKTNAKGQGKRISFQNNIVGAQPIVPLAMMGIPNCMIDMKMKPIKCKVIDIYYDITVTCGYSSEDITRNGQKILGVLIDLEKQGYRFNLYAVQMYNSSQKSYALTVKVKSSDQPLDIKRVSFPLTHPAFFRVIGFDWYSKTPKGKYISCYGTSLRRCFDSTDEMHEFTKKVYGENAVFFEGEEICNHDEQYIKEALTNAGQKKN